MMPIDVHTARRVTLGFGSIGQKFALSSDFWPDDLAGWLACTSPILLSADDIGNAKKGNFRVVLQIVEAPNSKCTI